MACAKQARHQTVPLADRILTILRDARDRKCTEGVVVVHEVRPGCGSMFSITLLW